MTPHANRRLRLWRIVAPLLALAVSVLLLILLERAAEARGLGLFEMLTSASALEDVVRSWGAWGPILSVLLMVLHSFVPFPAELVAIANGMLFGFAFGLFLTWVGAMLGALAAFALARWFGAALVEPMLSEKRWRQLRDGVEAGGVGALITARLIPIISFNLVNYAAGLLAVSWWRFTWTTAIGILPVTAASVLVGSHMVAAPPWVWLLLPLAALALWLGHRLVRRRHIQPTRPVGANSRDAT